MRLILTAALIFSAAALSGCGESEAAFRDAYRSRAVESCTNGARSVGAGAPKGLDFARVCECSVDRYMESRSIDQLRGEEDQTTAPPEARAALQQCLMEQMNALTGGARAGS